MVPRTSKASSSDAQNDMPTIKNWYCGGKINILERKPTSRNEASQFTSEGSQQEICADMIEDDINFSGIQGLQKTRSHLLAPFFFLTARANLKAQYYWQSSKTRSASLVRETPEDGIFAEMTGNCSKGKKRHTSPVEQLKKTVFLRRGECY